MSIKISNFPEKPALVYDRFFLCSLSLEQSPQVKDNLAPLYKLQVQYRLYAVDSNGDRYYQTVVNHITIDDYYTAAMVKAQQGDMDLAGAMIAIEAALAKIIEDQTDLGSAQVIS